MGGLEPHHSVGGGGPAHRASGIGPEAEEGVAGSDGGTRSSRRAGRAARRVMGVSGDASERTHRAPGSELAHVQLREEDRSRVAQFLHEERIVRRHGTFEQEGAGGRRQVGGVEVVLERHRNPVERRPRPGFGALPVEASGTFPGAGIQQQDRADPGAVLVVGSDPGEEQLDELLGSDGSAIERFADFGDRGFGEPELSGRLGGEQRCREQRDQEADHRPMLAGCRKKN